ncbi:acetylcholinesterase-like [Styela clava]
MKIKFAIILLCLYICKRCKADLSFAENVAGAFRQILAIQGFDVPNLQPLDSSSNHENSNAKISSKATELSPVITTTSGPVQGAKYPESYAFYSVPYALPPIRYQPPEPIINPLSSINATVSDMLVCEQLKKNCSNGVCIHNTNEDCLVLNINVPQSVQFVNSVPTSQNRPVLVWFHGGGFFAGGATVPEFESRTFSMETNSIIVTANYRLGAFGFLVHGEGEDMLRGNQGLKDQQLALKWVQDNIGKFGGDPNMVTIFGNSAGGQSVMFHLVSETSKPLFHRAIMQSNPAVFQYQTLEEAKRVTNRLLRFLGCPNDTLANERQCLMDATPQQLNAGLVAAMPMSLYEDQDLWSTVEAFRPVLDGVEFTKQPFEMFQEGTWNTEKDLIVGTNTNELEIIQFYIPEQGPGGKPIPFTEAMYDALNRFLFGEEIGAKVSEKYKSTVSGPSILKDYEQILGLEASHMFFDCPSRLMAR